MLATNRMNRRNVSPLRYARPPRGETDEPMLGFELTLPLVPMSRLKLLTEVKEELISSFSCIKFLLSTCHFEVLFLEYNLSRGTSLKLLLLKNGISFNLGFS